MTTRPQGPLVSVVAWPQGAWRTGPALGGYVRAHPGCDVGEVAAAVGQPSPEVADALCRFSRSEALRCVDGRWWPADSAGQVR